MRVGRRHWGGGDTLVVEGTFPELAVEVSEVSEVKSDFFCLQLSVQLVFRVDLDLLTWEILYSILGSILFLCLCEYLCVCRISGSFGF